MEIFDFRGAKGYEMILCPGGYDDNRILGRLDGTPRKAGWQPILVKRVRPSRREGFRLADLPYFGGALILRRSAVDALRDILDRYGELLPLATEDGVELYVLNMRAIDALDEPRSKVEYFEGTDRISYLKRPVFIQSAIEDVDIFKLRRDIGNVYVSDRFVVRVKAANLKGLEFTKVWSSDVPI